MTYIMSPKNAGPVRWSLVITVLVSSTYFRTCSCIKFPGESKDVTRDSSHRSIPNIVDVNSKAVQSDEQTDIPVVLKHRSVFGVGVPKEFGNTGSDLVLSENVREHKSINIDINENFEISGRARALSNYPTSYKTYLSSNNNNNQIPIGNGDRLGQGSGNHKYGTRSEYGTRVASSFPTVKRPNRRRFQGGNHVVLNTDHQEALLMNMLNPNVTEEDPRGIQKGLASMLANSEWGIFFFFSTGSDLFLFLFIRSFYHFVFTINIFYLFNLLTEIN